MVEQRPVIEEETCVGGGYGFAVDITSNNPKKILEKQKKKKKKRM
jgi:hypothetical protein